MGICYCENHSCHKIYPASEGLKENPHNRPLLPCGHRLATIVFSAVSLRENASVAKKLEALEQEGYGGQL